MNEELAEGLRGASLGVQLSGGALTQHAQGYEFHPQQHRSRRGRSKQDTWSSRIGEALGKCKIRGMTSNQRLRLAEGCRVRAHLAAHISSRWSEPLSSLKYQLKVKRQRLLSVEFLPGP